MTAVRATPPPDPTLDDCASEPIHIPGAIQPHGAMLVFEGLQLVAWSANFQASFGGTPASGARCADIGLRPELVADLQDILQDESLIESVPVAENVGDDVPPIVRCVHRHDGRTIVEFERLSSDRLKANLTARMFARVKVAQRREDLLSMCCAEIREWTGFDRVMAYVFHPDGSGEVVAESRSDRIDSFLNMRFPASDIPDQARRLYVLNTLRFIPDVQYRPVALYMDADARPVDLSFAALRSVSPIHIEYLGNMGVRASMSVSIVLDGTLWGLFACHHNEPLSVGPATRQACDMLAHFVASRVQSLQSLRSAEQQAEAAALTGRIAGQYASADDAFQYLCSIEGEIRRILRAEGLVVVLQGKVLGFGGVPNHVAMLCARHVAMLASEPFMVEDRSQWPESMRDEIGAWVGALSIDFDPSAGGFIVALRREQVTTVKWSGNPGKTYAMGPNGPRLSPRGSFAEWRETVVGRCAPWSEETVRTAHGLRAELLRTTALRHAEIEQARRHLLAMLGHDLRDPLHTIRMAANLLQRDEASKAMANRIDNSSGRMQRLIGQILDFSRAEAGMQMLGTAEEIDLAQLLDDLVEESRLGHPGVPIQTRIQRPARFRGDPGRISQAIGNLLSNARHHAEPGSLVDTELETRDGHAHVVVANVAPPIPAEVVAVLFEPLKRVDPSQKNRSGLGLGLYIAHRIAAAMHGSLAYAYVDGRVVFTLTLRSA